MVSCQARHVLVGPEQGITVTSQHRVVTRRKPSHSTLTCMQRSAPSVVVLGINYPPEHSGISPYTGAMTRALASRGWDVRTFTAHPHYPQWRVAEGYGGWFTREDLDGVSVTRLRHYIPSKPRGVRRLLSELSFGVRLATVRWRGASSIVLVSPALISSWIAAQRAWLTHRGTPLVVWVQDLYTLGMAETGEARGAILGIMRWLEGSLLRRADRVVVIHDRFARRVSEDFGIPIERIDVVRNWTHVPPSPPIDVESARAERGWSSGDIVVLHAGNMGVKQGLDNVVAAARVAEACELPVKFVLLGTGAELPRLQANGSGLTTLEFIAPLDEGAFARALGAADVLLVNELPGVSEMAVPSKLTSYFAAGRPVVAATDLTGITAEEVLCADAGRVAPAGDPAALLAAVLELANDPSQAARLGDNGRRYRRSHLDESAAVDRFSEALERCIFARA